MNTGRSGVWDNPLSLQYRGGEPLRPPAQVAPIVHELALAALAGEEQKQVVLLGVTPELAHLPWPSQVRLMAFDQSAPMLASVWVAPTGIPSQAQRAKWQALPLAPATADLIVGDGCTTQLPDAAAYAALLAELARVMTPQAKLVMRCFVRPPEPEPIAQVIADAQAGRIVHFGTLKWRIAMASMASSALSIAVQDILAAFDRAFPDRQKLHQASGWSQELISTIEVYRGSPNHYTFPTLQKLSELAAPFFRIEEVRYGDYELGERCPVIRFCPAKA